MMPVVFGLPGNEALAHSLAAGIGAELGVREVRRFPDGDSYVRIDTDITDRTVILVSTLDRPDEKFLPLSLVAATARELGATRVGLIAPYLAYMRQDMRFRAGEAISSVHFAQLLSSTVDWLVTVDPHLHRHRSLNEIFTIPALVVHAAPLLAEWIKHNVSDPVLIGPDGESEQWVASVAAHASAPYLVLEKTRTGDRNVVVSMPNLGTSAKRTPVLVDDIISTGRTMIDAIHRLSTIDHRSPRCVGVHAVFAGDAYAALRTAGAARIVTCNTIPHESNGINMAPPIAEAVSRILAG